MSPSFTAPLPLHSPVRVPARIPGRLPVGLPTQPPTPLDETVLFSSPEDSFCDLSNVQLLSPGHFFGSCMSSAGTMAATTYAVRVEVPPHTRYSVTSVLFAANAGATGAGSWISEGDLSYGTGDANKPDGVWSVPAQTAAPGVPGVLGHYMMSDASLKGSLVTTPGCSFNGGQNIVVQWLPGTPLLMENPSSTPRYFWVSIVGAAQTGGAIPTLLCSKSTKRPASAVFCANPVGSNITCFTQCTMPECNALSSTLCYGLPEEKWNTWVPATELEGADQDCVPHIQLFGTITPLC